MSDIYRKTDRENKTEDNQLKNIIRVVPSPFWLILLGAFVIVCALLIWITLGWRTTSVSTSGIYHPGVSSQGEIICFPDISTGKTIQEGMTASIYLVGCDQSKNGHMTGTVTYADPYVTDAATAKTLLGDDALTALYTSNGPVVCVICKLDENPDSTNGYQWTNENGNSVKIADGTMAQVDIVISREHPSLKKLQ